MYNKEHLVAEWIKVCNKEKGDQLTVEQEAGYWLHNWENPVIEFKRCIINNVKFDYNNSAYWKKVYSVIKYAVQ